MKIAGRSVGSGSSPYVIAEIGVNHDGRADRAAALIDAARRADADAVKFQFFQADRLLGRSARLAAYQRDAGAVDAREMLRALELTADELAPLVDHAHACGLHALVTVFNLELVDAAAALPWDAFKVASPDLVNRPLLEALRATGRPMILSTGAADAAEITRAVEWLGRRDLAVLHCVSAYPTPDEEANLAAVAVVARLAGTPGGYSDHTVAVDTGALAVAAGASILEKHLTHDRAASGPDHAASLDPHALAEYIRLARRAGRMLGEPDKRARSIERDVRDAARQSLVAARDLQAGGVIQRADLAIRRPAGGFEPWRLDEVLGRRLARDLPAGTPLRDQDLAPAVATVV